MKCKIVIDNNVECDEPELIPGCCYDHAVLCKECGIEPAHPKTPICDRCNTKLYQEYNENKVGLDG